MTAPVTAPVTAPLPGPPDPEAWNDLAERAGNFFASHVWAACWWREWGEGHTPQVLCDDPADPRVLLPIYVSGRGLRQARFIGHGPADQLGPVCRPGDAHLAAGLLRRAVRDRTLRADVLLLQDMPTSRPWWASLPGSRVRVEQSPVLRFDHPTTWEAWLAGKSKNFRDQVKQRQRRLEREHQVTFRAATQETLDGDLTHFFRLHSLRWAGESTLLTDAKQRFLRDVAHEACRRGWLRLRLLELDGRPVAASLGFRFGGDEYFYQGGRDPDLDDRSVGFVLLAHTVRQALESGAHELRLLRGDEPYKFRFATGPADIETVAVPTSLRGRVAVPAARLRRRHLR